MNTKEPVDEVDIYKTVRADTAPCAPRVRRVPFSIWRQAASSKQTGRELQDGGAGGGGGEQEEVGQRERGWECRLAMCVV